MKAYVIYVSDTPDEVEILYNKFILSGIGEIFEYEKEHELDIFPTRLAVKGTAYEVPEEWYAKDLEEVLKDNAKYGTDWRQKRLTKKLDVN